MENLIDVLKEDGEIPATLGKRRGLLTYQRTSRHVQFLYRTGKFILNIDVNKENIFVRDKETMEAEIVEGARVSRWYYGPKDIFYASADEKLRQINL